MTKAKAFRISLAGTIYSLVFFTAVFFGSKRISPAISAVIAPDLTKQNASGQTGPFSHVPSGSFFPKRIAAVKQKSVGMSSMPAIQKAGPSSGGKSLVGDLRMGSRQRHAGMAMTEKEAGGNLSSVPSSEARQPLPDVSSLPTLREIIFKKANLLLSGNRSPRYPRVARINGYEGIVWIALQVTERGGVESANLVRSSGFKCLDRAAMEAVRDWRFSPAEKFGQAVSSRVELPVIFKLKPSSSEEEGR